MDSSSFSFDAFDDLLGTMARPSSTATTLASSLSIPSPSGESLALTLSGDQSAFMPSGVSSTRKYLLWVPSSSHTVCVGMVGSTKFCLKSPLAGEKSCGIIAHNKTKFSLQAHHGYLIDTDSRVLCAPVFDLASFTAAQRLRIQGVSLLAHEWEQLIVQVQDNRPPKWLAFVETATTPAAADHDPLSLLSPTAHDAPRGLLAMILALSFDDSTASSVYELDDANISSPSDLIPMLSTFRKNFSSLKGKWARAFTEVEACCGLMVQDIKKLQFLSKSLQSSVGDQPSVPGATSASSLWQCVSGLQELLARQSSSLQPHEINLASLSSNQEHLSLLVSSLEPSLDSSHLCSKGATVQQDLQALEQRVLRLLPILQQLSRGDLEVLLLPRKQTMELYHL